MAEEPVLLEEHVGPLLYLTLNRPHKLNALNRALQLAIQDALDRAEGAQGVRVIVLRGAGRCFSVGHDVSPEVWDSHHRGDVRDPLVDQARDYEEHLRWLRLWDFPKPIITQVHGYCLAAATLPCSLADLNIVADDAVIGFVKLPLGGGYVSPAWVHQVGAKRAKEMSFVAGSSIDGRTAAAWGWANRSVPADRLEDEVLETGLKIAATPSSVLRMKKMAINRMVEANGFRQAFLTGGEVSALVHHSSELDELRQRVQEEGWKAASDRFHSEIAEAIERARRRR